MICMMYLAFTFIGLGILALIIRWIEAGEESYYA